MRLLSQSTRTTIRTLTLLFALTSLLLTFMTPFARHANAQPDNFAFAGFILLDNGDEIDLGDPNLETSWTESGQNVSIDGYEWSGNSDGTFHLSCSATLVGTDVTVVSTGEEATIIDFAIHRENLNNADEPLQELCTADTFADLELEKSASEGAVSPGDQFTYEVKIENTATGEDAVAAVDVVLSDSVPSPLVVTDVEPDECSHEGNDVECQVGTLEAGAFFTATITVDVPESAPCGRVDNIAQGEATNAAPDESNSASITIEGCDDPEASLTVIKNVVNNHGDAQPGHFDLFIDETGVDSGKTTSQEPGTYEVSETIPTELEDAYAPAGVACYDTEDYDAEGEDATELPLENETDTSADVTLADGDDVTCVITNVEQPGHLLIQKEIEDPQGLYPDAMQDDFIPTVDGMNESWDTEIEKAPDTYTIGEIDSAEGPGYLADGRFIRSVACEDDDETNDVDQATVELGKTATCTITNTAVGAGLVLVKDVDNDWGGQLGPEDFTLLVDGDKVAEDQESEVFPAGTYEISEVQEEGYEFVGLTCMESNEPHPFEPAEGEEGTFTVDVDPDETVICTFQNRDIPASLTILKDVTNDDGGTATAEDFLPTLGYEPFDNPEGVQISSTMTPDAWGTHDVDAGIYTIGEMMLVDGYVLEGIECARGEETFAMSEVNELEIEIGLDDDVTCTINNDDEPPFVIVGEPTISAELLAPTCENDTPYLVYEVTVTNTDATTATIHWFDADGVEQHTDEVDNLSGRVLWPGAEVDEDDEPIDWPGWIQQSDGTWVEGDDGFAWAREGAQVAVEVNPTTDLMSVEYPPPTPNCDASPPEVEVAGEQFEQPAPAAKELPRTGLDTGRMALWAALLAGLGALILLATDTPTATVRQRR